MQQISQIAESNFNLPAMKRFSAMGCNYVGVTYYFACQRWFARDEDDGAIERDLLPGLPKPDTQSVQYVAEVFTSDKKGAGTTSDVSLELFGHLGSSGVQKLNVCFVAPLSGTAALSGNFDACNLPVLLPLL